MIVCLARMAEAIPAKVYALEFSSLGILLILHFLNLCSLDVTIAKYLIIRSSMASYSFNIYATTNWESLGILRF